MSFISHAAFNANAANPSSYFVFEGMGLYLRNDSNMLVSATLQPPIPPPAPTISGGFFQPDYGFGFDLTGEYYRNDKGVSLEWIQYDKISKGEDRFGDVFTNNFFALRSRFNIVNLTIPYELHILDKINMKFSIGVQYAKLEESWRESIIANVPFNFNDGRETDAAKAAGIGPYFGVNIDAPISKNFGALFGFNLAMLNFKHTLESTVSRIQGSNNNALTEKNMVPGINVKLGGSYTIPISKGDLTAKIAWDKRIYTSGFFAGGNMAWSGLLFGLKWVG
jgi:hypothetical protein